MRIWPLYYLAIIIALLLLFAGFISLDKHHFFLFYLFFIPNVAFVLKMTILPIVPLWSVGVEEQFYAFWPWLIKYSRNLYKVFLCVIIVYFILKLIARFSNMIFYELAYITTFDCMAIGSIGALLAMQKNNSMYFKVIYNKYCQILAWLVLLFSCIYKPIHIFSFIDQEVNALVYLILILNVSRNPKTIISLENKFFDFIGKISYGIYVYHFIIIVILSNLIKNKLPDNYLGYTLIFLIIIGSTILVSYFSYKYFEKRFLNQKVRFSSIISKHARNE
ncbi:MAG: acyltransferase family protein [Bacteroidales bacterium]